MNNLARRSIDAAKWSAVFTVGRFGLQFIAQVVLARLLGPASYGVFAMALVVYTLSYFFATFGFAWGLAQLKEMGDEEIRFAFTWQLIAGAAAGALLFACAPLIAGYFHEPQVLPVVHWMSLACVLNAASSVSAGVQRRQLAFKRMGVVQMASYAVGYLGVGIPMAFMGFGVMALVTAWLVQAAAALGLGLWACPHPVRPLFYTPQARQLFNTGGAVLLTNLGNWAITSVDRLVIGRLLSTELIGIYSAGYNLANLPATLLVGSLQPVFHAAGARLQDEPERLKSAYQMAMAGVLVILLPCFAVAAVLAPELVLTIYGRKWIAAGPVLAVLLAVVPGMVVWGFSTPVLWNTGRPYQEFWLQLPLLVLAGAALVLVVPYGVGPAAWVAAALVLARCAVLCTAACRALQLPLRDFAADFARALVLGTPMVLAALAVPALLPVTVWPVVRLVAGLAGGGLAALLQLWLRPGVLGPQAGALLRRLAPRFAARLKS